MIQPPAPPLFMYTIYFSPLDVPGKFVVRRFEIRPLQRGEPVPLDVLAITTTLDEARDALPPDCGAMFPRQHDDHPSVIETWI
jgi:hypothetical protein